MEIVILYIHGKGGNALEAKQYKDNCLGFDIVGLDYEIDFPWIVEKPINDIYYRLSHQYECIYVIANSIGAYFTMHTLKNCKIEKALFISPIVNMERVILDMMKYANVSEEQLRHEGEIKTDFGEILSWKYLKFVRNHPIEWYVPTEILYPQNDHLTSIKTINEFVSKHNAKLTIMENGEHWFHTDEQLTFLNHWMKKVI